MNVKSCPKTCVNPLATRQPLNCEICPSLSRLIRSTHLHCTAFLPGGSSDTSSYTSFAFRASSSSCIAASHSFQYFERSAWRAVGGSRSSSVVRLKAPSRIRSASRIWEIILGADTGPSGSGRESSSLSNRSSWLMMSFDGTTSEDFADSLVLRRGMGRYGV